MLHQPPAENGSNCGGDRGKARPCADRLAATFIVERRTDNRETSWYQQRSSQALNASGHEQLINVGSRTASCGCGGKDPHAHHEDHAAAKQIAQRAADQYQRAQEQTVRLNDPLHIHHGCLKARLDRRQGNIDDRAVDKGHAGAKDGRREYPQLRSFATLGFVAPRSQYGLITRRFHRGYGCDSANLGSEDRSGDGKWDEIPIRGNHLPASWY